MNKKIKIASIIFLLFFLTGCRSNFTHEEKVYTENILCAPEKSETREIYIENDVDVSTIPECNDFKVMDNNYEGVWNTLFVSPLAWLLINIGNILKSYGFAIITVTLLLRLIVMPITAKTAAQSENMKKAKGDLADLEKKYKNLTDRDSLMKKSQEQSLIYKKHDVKPLTGCLFALIQIPLFFAFFEAINRVPVIFEEKFIGLFELGRSPLEALKLGNPSYLIFVVLIVIVTYFSFKLNSASTASDDQANQMQMMMKFMIVFIGFMSFNLSTGIGLYWIFNSLFTILQNLFFKMKKERKNV